MPHLHDGDLVSPSKLARAVLVTCEHCGIQGPKDRHPDHVRVDHRGARPPAPYVLALPGRFRGVLEAIATRTGRSPAEAATRALDEWLTGRRPLGYRKSVYTTTHWGRTG